MKYRTVDKFTVNYTLSLYLSIKVTNKTVYKIQFKI